MMRNVKKRTTFCPVDFIHKYDTIKCQHLGKYPLKEFRTLEREQDTRYETIGQDQAGNNNIGQDTGENYTGHDSTGKEKGPEQYRGMMENKRQERKVHESHDRTGND
jgi:hypothetical protein